MGCMLLSVLTSNYLVHFLINTIHLKLVSYIQFKLKVEYPCGVNCSTSCDVYRVICSTHVVSDVVSIVGLIVNMIMEIETFFEKRKIRRKFQNCPIQEILPDRKIPGFSTGIFQQRKFRPTLDTADVARAFSNTFL